MSEVKRYDAVHLRYEGNNIRYGEGCEVEVVPASDYGALAAECDRLRESLKDADAGMVLFLEQRDAALAELAALKGGRERQQLVVGSTYTSTRGFGRLLYLGETHDIDGWLPTFRTTEGKHKHYSHDQLTEVLEEFAAPLAQASAWVSEGWKLVPIDPSGRQQFNAAFNLCSEFGEIFVRTNEKFALAVYRELVAAAPTPGASDGKD